jgi:superfamily I DNA/RNA helicase
MQREDELAEQERLFFVALTRTKNTLIISSTGIMRRGDAARMSVSATVLNLQIADSETKRTDGPE